MTLSVTQKIALGFATLVISLLVIVTGAVYGINNISSSLSQISQRSVPNLNGGFTQMISLQEANQALYSTLSQKTPETTAAQQERFNNQVTAFNTQLDQLKTQLYDPQLQSLADDIQQSSTAFFLTASEMTELHLAQLTLTPEVTQLEIQLQKEIDDVKGWLQRYLSNPGLSKQRNKLARGVLRAVNYRLFQLGDYRTSANLKALQKGITRSKTMVTDALEKLIEADLKAKQIRTQVKKVSELLSGEQGLVSQYQIQQQLADRIAEQLLLTEQQVITTRASAEHFISVTGQALNTSRQQADELSQLIRNMLIIISSVVVLIAIITAVLTISTIRKPLRHIQTLLLQVRDGNLQTQFNQQRPDEFGQLGNSLNDVVAELQTVLTKVVEGSVKLASVAGQNETISRNTALAMQAQSEQLQQTSSAATELESSVAEVASHSNNALDAIQNCEQLSQELHNQVSNTLESINTQFKEISSAVSVSKQLAGYGNEIDNILLTIGDIARQTNLLALNAAIEAARAGEQGKGFAVVADEVRGLANRTQNSTQEIQNMVENMQASIHDVVTTMQRSRSQAEACVEHGQNSRQAIQNMTRAMTSVREMSTCITEATTQQNLAVESVSMNLELINKAAQDTASGAEQASSGSEELRSLADHQQTLVQRFQI